MNDVALLFKIHQHSSSYPDVEVKQGLYKAWEALHHTHTYTHTHTHTHIPSLILLASVFLHALRLTLPQPHQLLADPGTR